MRRATESTLIRVLSVNISIHALHEESDALTGLVRCGLRGISIHALHEESDILSMTLQCQPVLDDDSADISIHALHEESDWRRHPLCR